MLTILLAVGAGLLIAVVFFAIGATSKGAATEVRLTQPVRDLKSLSPEATEAIQLALKQDRKIDAIKLYREATGAGLRESKEAVEAMGG